MLYGENRLGLNLKVEFRPHHSPFSEKTWNNWAEYRGIVGKVKVEFLDYEAFSISWYGYLKMPYFISCFQHLQFDFFIVPRISHGHDSNPAIETRGTCLELKVV